MNNSTEDSVYRKIEKNKIAIEKLKSELKILDSKIEEVEFKLKKVSELINYYEDTSKRIFDLDEKMKQSREVPEKIKLRFESMVNEAERLEDEMSALGITSLNDYNKLSRRYKQYQEMHEKYTQMIISIEQKNEYFQNEALKPIEIEAIQTNTYLEPEIQYYENNPSDITGNIDENEQYDNKYNQKYNEKHNDKTSVQSNIENKSIDLHAEFKRLLLRLKNEFQITIPNIEQFKEEFNKTEQTLRILKTRYSITKEIYNRMREIEQYADRLEKCKEKVRKLNEDYLDDKGSIKDQTKIDYYKKNKAIFDNQIRIDMEFLYDNNILNYNDFDEKDTNNKRELNNLAEEIEEINKRMSLLNEIQNIYSKIKVNNS